MGHAFFTVICWVCNIS